MRYTVVIDGHERSVLLDSIQINSELSGRSSTCSFNIPVKIVENTYDYARYDEAYYNVEFDISALPSQQSEVIISNQENRSERIFLGYVTSIERTQFNRESQLWKLNCVGPEFLLENMLVDESFVDKTDKEILQSLFEEYLPEIDTDDVSELLDPITIEFKDVSMREVCEKLSTLSGAVWRVHERKKLIWNSAEDVTVAPFGFSSEPDNVTSFHWRNATRTRQSNGFVNKITYLGGYVGTERLRSVAENLDSQTSLGRVIEIRLADASITNQAVLDLAASIELDKHGVLESCTFTHELDGLSVGMLIPCHSIPLSIDGNYIIQSISQKQLTQEKTQYQVTIGDYQGSLIQRMVALEKLRNPALLAPVPPPDASVTNEKIVSLDFGKVENVSVISSQIESVDFGKVENVSIIGSMIQNLAITNQHINDLDWSKISNIAIVNSNISGTLNFNKIDSSSVSIANSQLAGSIAFSKLDSSTVSITNSQLAGSIAFSKLDSSSVSITNSQLAGSIAFSKLNQSTVSITESQISGDISFSKLTSVEIVDSMIDTVDFSKLRNVVVTGSMIGTLQINGDLHIQDDSIDSVKISSISADKITGGTITGTVSINSSGDMTATSGAIGGCTFISSVITAGTISSGHCGAGSVDANAYSAAGSSGETVTLTVGSFTSLVFKAGLLVGHS